MLPVPEAEPVDPLPAPAPDCAIIHALASTRIARTWSKRFIVIISLTCFMEPADPRQHLAPALIQRWSRMTRDKALE
jgi:hypothetical protein